MSIIDPQVKDFLIAIIGKPRSGKTVLLKALIKECAEKKNFDSVLIFSHTGRYTENFGDIIPEQYIHTQYDEEVLEQFAKFHAKARKDGNPLRSLVIFDDCFGAGGVKHNTGLVQSIACEYRQLGLSLCFAHQYISHLPSSLQSLANYFVIFQDANRKLIKERIAPQYGSLLAPVYKDAEKLMIKIISELKKYHFLLIDKDAESKEKMYRVMTVKPPKKFRLEY